METRQWIFRAYESQEAFDNKDHFFEKVFSDFDKMKNFSAEHSARYKYNNMNPDYCSMYWDYPEEKPYIK